MSTAIACDFIYPKLESQYLLARVFELYQDAPLYTIYHQRGVKEKIIEERKVFSTYLSRIIKDFSRLHFLAPVIPFAAKNLFIPCEYETVVHVSHGLSGLIRHCEKSKIILVLASAPADRGYFKEKKSFFDKFLEKKFWESVEKADEIFTTDYKLFQLIKAKGYSCEYLDPPLPVDKAKIIPVGQLSLDIHLILPSKDKAYNKEVEQELIDANKDYRFLVYEKGEYKKEKMISFEEELVPLFNSVNALVSLEYNRFDFMSVMALGCGIPVFARGDQLKKRVGLFPFSKIQEVFEAKVPDRSKMADSVKSFRPLSFKKILKTKIG